jgi:hypothetical protein
LFYFSKVVFRVLIESKFAHWYERTVSMRPYFSDIEDVISIVLPFLLSHHLHIEGP